MERDVENNKPKRRPMFSAEVKRKPVRQKVNYLNNADLLVEIHKSKMSFSYVEDEKYSSYDLIVFEQSDINHETLKIAKAERVKRINNFNIREVQKELNCTPKKAIEHLGEETLLKIEDVEDSDVVFRLMCDDWIPTDPDTNERIRVNFKPFKQFILKDSELHEVARSHWKGDLESGCFSMKHGRLTESLGKMLIELCERTSNKSNFRGYTYLEEMVGDAKLQLVWKALNFDESRESLETIKQNKPIQLNPFSYYTTFVHHAFMAVLNAEKKNRNIRDDLLMEQGYDPSTTRITEMEQQMYSKKLEQQENNNKPKSTMDDPSMWGDE